MQNRRVQIADVNSVDDSVVAQLIGFAIDDSPGSSRVTDELRVHAILLGARRPTLTHHNRGLVRIVAIESSVKIIALLTAAGLPELKAESKALAPLRKEAEALNIELNKLDGKDPARKELIGKIKANFGQQKPLNDKVKAMGDKVQLHQELGGLVGRIILAVLLIVGISRVKLLKIFQIPAMVLLPLTYFKLFEQGGQAFLWAYAICGLLTVAQFSYFGEYLPKVFPLHLRGTGESFAANIGGRVIGTSMAWVFFHFSATPPPGQPNPVLMTNTAAIIALVMGVVGILLTFFLPEPLPEDEAGH